ncbi:Ada DNA repair metal-binding [Penicillium macrosclerotiorum]|uniref:Ada DNA repair metal-binding n=1 Tax=Penicillium macrosclerotiorum TaxID=303699 RepID=UPI00254881EE|nr:Ada DNA repair metal-binding [Penicillium macrosclerotiorum]KAJ5689161.1 Ada DNA repair metal-binding [Penicillium macrosclerotiorum]
MSTSKSAPQKIPRLTRPGDTLTSAQRWQAITTRDATINSFVYAVLTTKIYCRPSCAARLARRANVQFYDTPAQAEAAGFRPCKRCRPQSGRTAVESNPQTAIVQQACAAIRGSLAAGLKPRLQDLAARVGLTPSHFHRVFKKHTGVTPGRYYADLAEGRASESSGAGTPGSLSELGTPRLDMEEGGAKGVLQLDAGESLLNLLFPETGAGVGVGDGLSAVACEQSPWILAEPDWNEFDVLLAAQQGLGGWSSDSLFTEPSAGTTSALE